MYKTKKMRSSSCRSSSSNSLTGMVHQGGRSCTGAQVAPAEKFAQLPKRVKTKKKFTGAKIGTIFCKITSRINTKKLKIGP